MILMFLTFYSKNKRYDTVLIRPIIGAILARSFPGGIQEFSLFITAHGPENFVIQ